MVLLLLLQHTTGSFCLYKKIDKVVLVHFINSRYLKFLYNSLFFQQIRIFFWGKYKVLSLRVCVSKRGRYIRKIITLKINLPTKNSKWQTEDNNILTRLQVKNKNKSMSLVNNIVKQDTSISLSGNYSEWKTKLHATCICKHKMFKTT